MLRRPGILPVLVEPGNWPGRQLPCWEMKALLHLESRVVKVFIASRQINKLDTRGLLFTCVSLTCTDDQRFWLLFSLSHTHTLTVRVSPLASNRVLQWKPNTGLFRLDVILVSEPNAARGGLMTITQRRTFTGKSFWLEFSFILYLTQNSGSQS